MPPETFWKISFVSLLLNLVAMIIAGVVWAASSLWQWLFL